MKLKLILLSFISITYLSISNANANSIFDNEDNEYYQTQIKDPLEPINKKIFKFNFYVDKYTIKPLAKIYKNHVPTQIKSGLRNFTQNLSTPLSALSSLFILDFKNSAYNLTSFSMNSTFGLLGFFNITSKLSQKEKNINFVNVFKHYKFDEGIYLVLPLLGPQTSTNFIAAGLNTILNPLYKINYNNNEKEIAFRTTTKFIEIIDFRASNYNNINNLYNYSLDPYIAVRNIYYQNHEN
jgi:phospholipid-binding lipoprotein MlaA